LTSPRASAPTFAELGAPAGVARSLAARHIHHAFPIQAATLPDALAGRDLCGRAPTGSGKTIAFGIPLVTRIGRAQPRRPRGLVLVPTRELAAQVREELVLLAGPKGPRIDAFYGGAGFDRQLKALRRGVDIVVACPGRLADLIGRGEVRLDAVEVAVVDEADRMADMGFLPEVCRLLDQVPAHRQTLLFSATLDGAVDGLIRRYQRDPVRHLLPDDPRDGARVEHLFWSVARDQRAGLCATVVRRLGPTIVFCRTKHGADRLARQLDTAGVRSAAIHGNRSQGQRERALAAFDQGKVDVLVATDVAARGIHVDGVAAVVHYDPPADDKDYVHRSGRTGRAGAEGVVLTFVGPEQRRDVAALQRQLGLPAGLTEPDVELDGAPSRPAAGPARTRTPRPDKARAERSATSRGPARRPGASRADQPRGPKSRPGRGRGAKKRAAAATTAAGPNRAARRAHLQPDGKPARSKRAGGRPAARGRSSR
jgi:superfamily II DNA/RNA helicase